MAESPRSLLFVCTGNICRSPLAHWYAVKVLREMGRADVTVASASTLGITGTEAHPYSIEAAAADGLDIRAHRSQALTTYLLREADLVLGMSPEHSEICLEIEPDLGDRVRLFGAYRPGADADADIEDPLGTDLAAFRETWREIRECVDFLLAQEFSPGAR